MDLKFEAAYKALNAAQREAVDTVEGPVLVVAGPGTGKTQLLSLRVANILRLTDAAPNNILCLTFTDNAARNMRERLQTIIGQSAYHIAIHTFHSFGSEIINQFSDYFTQRQMLQQVDELGRYEVLKNIFEALPHSNPLSPKVGDDFVFLKDSLAVISWLKQNAVTPVELHELINANQTFIEAIESELSQAFAATPSPKQLPRYAELLKKIQTLADKTKFGFPNYAIICAAELEAAIADTPADGRYATKITAWRNAWCLKDADGQHVLKDAGRNLRKMHAVANIYQKFIDALAEQGLYDFDDMIMEVVHALEADAELRFSLQERYQYVLVDEFQDTNKAQLRMLTALGDNPVHEQRPNIMAVGDDDQAIYAFQGAEASNMVAFARQYRQPKLITLSDNYRSTPAILDASFAVAEQINDRLESVLPDTHKQLVAQTDHKINLLRHNNFVSELAQYDWIAEQIDNYIKQGIKPEQIAVIAPRHRYLERLMPYLGNRHLPVAYERRENILDSPIIIQLLSMVKLVVALNANRQADVDALFGEVLGYDFWDLPPELLMQLSLECYNKRQHWLAVLLDHKNKTLAEIAAWFVRLAKRSRLEPLEYILDQLVGGIADGTDSEYDELLEPTKSARASFVSPLRQFYFSPERYEQSTDIYLALLGQLSTLRHNLRQWKPAHALYAKDLVEFADLHQSAGLKIIDSNPHTQTTNAVQVMTAYKAKGLEFEVVFVINAQDEVWGPTARSRSSSISLPKNLPIAPSSDGNNDKLRLLFVALTRAKHSLHLTSYSQTLDNKLSPGLSFIMNQQGEPLRAAFAAEQIDKPASPQAVEILTTDWAYRFRQVMADKSSLFEPILADYKLSVTHLNNFLDVVNGGPQYFLLHNLLRFPEAPTPSAAYGDAIHKTLQWAHIQLRQTGSLSTIEATQAYFDDILARKQLRSADHKRLQQRGHQALELYFKQRGSYFLAKDSLERGFNNEGVVINGAKLSGKIDKLSFKNDGQASVIDFKTGKPAKSWQGKDEYEKLKLHKYRQQLLFYKLLIENSASFMGKYVVNEGGLEFIEADEQGKLVANLDIQFNSEELQNFIKLIGAVWEHIMNLDFPDISKYAQNLRGVNLFEQDLIDSLI
jgi:DNA helicase-2/ATP-dependent DNA helicase PcrA